MERQQLVRVVVVRQQLVGQLMVREQLVRLVVVQLVVVRQLVVRKQLVGLLVVRQQLVRQQLVDSELELAERGSNFLHGPPALPGGPFGCQAGVVARVVIITTPTPSAHTGQGGDCSGLGGTGSSYARISAAARWTARMIGW